LNSGCCAEHCCQRAHPGDVPPLVFQKLPCVGFRNVQTTRFVGHCLRESRAHTATSAALSAAVSVKFFIVFVNGFM
jgi:hypothetical protein